MHKSDKELTDVAAKLQQQTDGAYLLYDGKREAWVPRAIVENNNDGTFTMPVWLARDRGFVSSQV
jgi:hypothetical protein